MSRTSRIPHPPGSRFVSLYHWAVRRFGIAGAAVLGLLDFLDRAHDTPGQPLASRARIIAELEGIVGKHMVDQALKDLIGAGVIHRNEETTMGRRNWETRVEYSLDIAGLKQLLATPETGSSGELQNRDFRGLPKPGPDSGLIPGVPYGGIEVEEDLKKEAAARANTHCSVGAADAAAAGLNQKRKHPKRTASKIECWYPDEDKAATEIEALFPAEQIAAAVATVKGRNNSVGKPTSPVPALVAEELERAQRAAEMAERRAAEEAKRDAEVQSILPPEIQRQRAAALAAALRTGRINAQEIIA